MVGMKRTIASVWLIFAAGLLFYCLNGGCDYYEFVTDSSMVNKYFWNDRRGVTATSSRPVIPMQLPGPLDHWAGPGPKEIHLTVPGRKKATLDLYFLDSHESAPPRLEISINGKSIETIQVAPGVGAKPFRWNLKGKRSKHSIVIPRNLRGKGDDKVVIKNVGGSWVGFDKLTVKSKVNPWLIGGLSLFGLIPLIFLIQDSKRRGEPLLSLSRNSVKYFLFATTTLIASSILALLAGEVALRIIYSDGGTKTLAGPGMKLFVHSFIEGKERYKGNIETAKENGTNIFIQGDSITFGFGVKNWEAVYPNLLYQKLADKKQPYNMAVTAVPKLEVDSHRRKLYEIADSIDPDIIVYQWYHNDIEMEYCHGYACGVPELKIAFWRKFSFHKNLRVKSYLYFFLDNRLARALTDYNRSFLEYLTDDFAEGTMKGQRFRTEFYRWATVASAYADRVIVMLYPAIPFTGENPFHAQHDMMMKLSKPHTFHIDAYTTSKKTGDNYFTEGDGINHIARLAKTGINKPGLLVDAPPIPLKKGDHEVSFSLKTGAQIFETVAIIEVVRESTGEVLAKRRLSGKDFISKAKWQKFTLNFKTKDTLIKDLRFRVWYEGKADIAVDQISLPVDRTLELIDLIPHLSEIDTHVSDFDSHPNAKAQEVMAQVLYNTLTKQSQSDNK